MFCGYMNNIQQYYNSFARELTYAYKGQVNSSTTTHPFNMLLIQRIPDFIL